MPTSSRVRRVRPGDPRRIDETPETAPPADVVLQLQRVHGNQAVQRMLARKKKEKATDWPAEFKKAVKAGNWSGAAMACFIIDDATLRKLLSALSDADLGTLETEAQTLDAVLAGLGEKVHRHVSFQRHAPGKPAKTKDAKVTDEGDLGYEAKVDGGKVKVHTDAEFKLSDGTTFSEAFSLTYKGKHSSSTRWLQFIWREMEVEDPVKGNFRVDEALTTSGGSYRFTTDPTAPNYNTDTADPASPFYESAGVGNRTGEATTIFDQPSPVKGVVDRQLDGGATKVISRAHFVTYLVRDMDILQEVKIDVEWVFTSKADVPRSQSVSAAGAANALDPLIRVRLIQQFPDFDYLP